MGFLNECLPAEASGDILKVLEVPNFGDVQNMLDGFSGFSNFQKNLTEAGDDSMTITETTTVWTQFESGELPSHYNVPIELTKLNEMVSCDDITVVIN